MLAAASFASATGNATLLSRLPPASQFAARVGGVQHAIGAFCRWQRAAKSARRLVEITVGHIGADRRTKIPIAHPLPAV